ncbi:MULTISPECIES: universal stress protein [Streptomyces]|nr:universal stress protein [Streptomyces corchorusii]ALP00002.1 hypothetical protein SHL15_9083 [Streptomyces hygroscopicus subsp. limoneus]
MVAVDPSPARKSVVRMAGELARLTGAEVHVLHVVTTAVAGDAVLPVESDEAGQGVLDEALTQLLGMDVKAEGRILHGLTVQVADAVSRAATEFRADLLIISPHHRSSLAALLNPRVSDAVAHRSRMAVLLAPAND